MSFVAGVVFTYFVFFLSFPWFYSALVKKSSVLYIHFKTHIDIFHASPKSCAGHWSTSCRKSWFSYRRSSLASGNLSRHCLHPWQPWLKTRKLNCTGILVVHSCRIVAHMQAWNVNVDTCRMELGEGTFYDFLKTSLLLFPLLPIFGCLQWCKAQWCKAGEKSPFARCNSAIWQWAIKPKNERINENSIERDQCGSADGEFESVAVWELLFPSWCIQGFGYTDQLARLYLQFLPTPLVA